MNKSKTLYLRYIPGADTPTYSGYYLSLNEDLTKKQHAEPYFREDGNFYESTPTYYRTADAALAAAVAFGFNVEGGA